MRAPVEEPVTMWLRFEVLLERFLFAFVGSFPTSMLTRLLVLAFETSIVSERNDAGLTGERERGTWGE